MKPGETARGVIPAVEVTGPNLEQQEVKLIPWTDAARVGPENKPNPKVFGKAEPIPQHVFEEWERGLPTPVRRTARQRYDVLVKRLLETGRETQARAGYPLWPESVQVVLDSLGFSRQNKDLNAQVYALAKHYIVKSENQQREKDSHKTVRDFHGHYD